MWIIFQDGGCGSLTYCQSGGVADSIAVHREESRERVWPYTLSCPLYIFYPYPCQEYIKAHYLSTYCYKRMCLLTRFYGIYVCTSINSCSDNLYNFASLTSTPYLLTDWRYLTHVIIQWKLCWFQTRLPRLNCTPNHNSTSRYLRSS